MWNTRRVKTVFARQGSDLLKKYMLQAFIRKNKKKMFQITFQAICLD